MSNSIAWIMCMQNSTCETIKAISTVTVDRNVKFDWFGRIYAKQSAMSFKVARYSFWKKNWNLRFGSVFLENYYLFEDKEYFCYVKQHLKSRFHKSCTTSVAMATMTFQNGGYFGFKVISLEKDIGDPLFLFQKIFLLGILNYFVDFKKIL